MGNLVSGGIKRFQDINKQFIAALGNGDQIQLLALGPTRGCRGTVGCRSPSIGLAASTACSLQKGTIACAGVAAGWWNLKQNETGLRQSI